MNPSIGFMQGRLSPMVDGKIQAFPADKWREEFSAAGALGIGLMEWTLDQDGLYDNPLMNAVGRAEIRRLSAGSRITIPSLTGDCFMQAPFYKTESARRVALLADFAAIIAACGEVGIGLIVVPLVDHGGIENEAQEQCFFDGLAELESALRMHSVRIAFESDLPPEELAAFIAKLPINLYGINYDIGNSAALGFDVDAEIAAYGMRIYNVHVKDRVLGGNTVPLGTGNADLPHAVTAIMASGYQGNYILQTARATDGDHGDVLKRYRDMVAGWLGVEA